MSLSHLSWEQFQEHLDKHDAETKHWDFDVMQSTHDEMKEGKTEPRRTRVVLSKEAFPDALEAEQVAALMPIARGQYTTRVGLRY